MVDYDAELNMEASITVNISPSADMTLRVIEYEEDTTSEPTVIIDFRVCREVISTSSIYFSTMLSSKFRESSQEVVILKEDDATAWEIWLRQIHGTLTDASYKVHDTRLRPLLEIADKYSLNVQELKSWFREWSVQDRKTSIKVEQNKEQGFWELKRLYACWLFDDNKGFAHVTRNLAYSKAEPSIENIGEIRWYPPSHTFDTYHEHETKVLRPIMTRLMQVQGNLRHKLSRQLCRPIQELQDKIKCTCRANAIFSYRMALSRTDVWSLEDSLENHPVTFILEKLKDFRYTNESRSCHHCDLDFAAKVKEACDSMVSVFEGLCLSCMYKSGLDCDSDWSNGSDNDDVIASKIKNRHVHTPMSRFYSLNRSPQA